MNAAPLALLLVLAAAPAGAACGTVAGIVAQADAAEIEPPPGAETCGTSLSEGGGRAVHCRWAFAYRSEEAASFFARLDAEVAACWGDEARATADPGVNHPDSYDLRQYMVDGRKIAISLKDKAAQGKTYVFVRVGP